MKSYRKWDMAALGVLVMLLASFITHRIVYRPAASPDGQPPKRTISSSAKDSDTAVVPIRPSQGTTVDTVVEKSARPSDPRLDRIPAAPGNEPRPGDVLNRTGPAGEPDTAASDTGQDRPPSATLTRETVLEGIEAFKPVVRECYENTLEDFPEAEGSVTIKFRVIGEDGAGRVELSELDEEKTSLYDEQLHECMLRGIGEVEFETPEGGGAIQVTYPFQFEVEPTP